MLRRVLPAALAALLPPLLTAAEPVPAPADPAGETPDADVILVTAARLPKYRVAESSAAALVDMPPEKVPFTVDTLTEDFIRERNPTDLDQLLSLQPGVYQGGKTVMARHAGKYTIRGYSGSEVLLNGVPLAGGIGTFLDVSLLERVDIVKGPVGGAYGSQSNDMSDVMGAGGTVLLTAKRPRFDGDFSDYSARASYSGDSGSRLKFTADINRTVDGSENAALRIPFAYEWREPGWAPSGARHGSTWSAAPSVTLRPADRLEAGFDLFFQQSDQPAYQGLLTLDGKPIGGDWDASVTEPGDRMKFRTFGAAFRADGMLTDRITLRTRAAVFRTDNQYRYRGPSSSMSPIRPYEWAAGDETRWNAYLSQDVLLKHGTGELEGTLLLGANLTYKHERGKGSFTSLGPVDLSRLETERAHQRKIGLNAQEILAWRGLSVIAGLRSDYHTSVKGATAWTHSPRFGLSYDIAEAGLAILFANVSLTDTPNFNLKQWTRNDGTSSDTYLSSTWRAVQKEAGLRVNPVGRLWLTGTLFRIDQTNAPVAMSEDLGGGTLLTTYAEDGKTYSQGFEFSASGDLTDTLSVYLAYTYIDYYDKTRGLRFDRFPPHAVSLWTNYKAEWLGNTVLGFGARWRDDWLLTFRGQPKGERYCAKDLLTFDLTADIPVSDTVSFGLAVRNLFDTRGIESARNLQAFANDGRTFELSCNSSF